MSDRLPTCSGALSLRSFFEESSRKDYREEGNKGAVNDIDGPMLPGDNDGNDSQD